MLFGCHGFTSLSWIEADFVFLKGGTLGLYRGQEKKSADRTTLFGFSWF